MYLTSFYTVYQSCRVQGANDTACTMADAPSHTAVQGDGQGRLSDVEVFKRCCVMEFLRLVLIRFRAEKLRSAVRISLYKSAFTGILGENITVYTANITTPVNVV